jgi:hypothetical protein
MLKRLVDAALMTGAVMQPQVSEPVAQGGKVSVRMRPDDLLLLRERANGRSLLASTYESYLIRAHLRRRTPLPTAELSALELRLAEVGTIGRNRCWSSTSR